MPAQFAMPVAVPSTPGDDAGLAARVAAGPGLWEDEDWLADLRCESLPESLLADGTIAAAAAAEHGHKQERALNAEATALCLVTGALFPVLGYDAALALVFNMPGLPARPGTPVPTGPAYSKARARSGEAPARAMFGHDAARDDIPAGPDGTAFGLEITQIDGTTLELFSDPLLADEFGVPSPGAKPLLRLVGLLHSGTRRWRAAVLAAATADLTPGEICFTAVLSLARAAVTADTCCPHCHKRPTSGNASIADLDAAILALPPGRADRQRTSGRTAAERRKWISEPADYTLTIVPSNLPKTDVSPGS